FHSAASRRCSRASSARALTSSSPGPMAAAASLSGYWSSRATPCTRASSQLRSATADSYWRCSSVAARARASASAASCAWRWAARSVQAAAPARAATSSRDRDSRGRIGFIAAPRGTVRAGRAGARGLLRRALGAGPDRLDRGGGDRVVGRAGPLEHLAGEGQAVGRLHQFLVDREDQLAPAHPLDELAGRRARLDVAAAQGQRIPAHGDLAVGRAGELVGLVQLRQLLGLAI